MELKLAYGDQIVTTEVLEKNFLGTLLPNELPSVKDENLEIQRAINNPIKSPKLEKIIKPNMRVSILADDHTRGTPSYLVMPHILSKLNDLKVPDENITAIFGCGTHRCVMPGEAEFLIGKETIKRIRIESHDCHAEDLVNIGKTSYGNEIKINSIVANSDAIITIGKLGYHYYAGFTGGRKSVLPGISSYETINFNHAMLIHPKAATGNLEGNPVHKDMVEAARLAKVDFIINLVKDSKEKMIKTFAGDLEAAHLEGTKLYDKMFRVTTQKRPDIVLLSAGGYPKDIDLYQGSKAIDNSKFLVRPGGVIIALLECREGVGNEVYTEWSKKYRTLEELEKQIKTNFVLGGHKAYYMEKVLLNSKVILVSEMSDKEVKEIYKLKPSSNVDDALEMAYNIVGRNASLMSMPYGTMTLPRVKN
ncbi:MAG: nickel-dependent lactate racemase [Candidatus Helarchaeota archaeon]|nr:nickel-dependent lactate racemase [Candidatus Helarchaeota archaeon]